MVTCVQNTTGTRNLVNQVASVKQGFPGSTRLLRYQGARTDMLIGIHCFAVIFIIVWLLSDSLFRTCFEQCRPRRRT
jgi:hypothetical protein